jgi:hypothetical protein
MFQVRLALATIGVLAFASASHAAPSFNDLDKNHDGVLSRAEASSVKGLDFVKADTNRDGHLDRAEYAAAVG